MFHAPELLQNLLFFSYFGVFRNCFTAPKTQLWITFLVA